MDTDRMSRGLKWFLSFYSFNPCASVSIRGSKFLFYSTSASGNALIPVPRMKPAGRGKAAWAFGRFED
jgi:hypothetical protein